MKDILKPCQFCGSAAIMTAYKTPAGERYRVVCPSCMASVDTGFAQSGHHAAKAWNRRTEKESENLLKYERALAIAMHDTRTAIQQANDNQLPLNIDSKWCNDHCKYGGKDKEVSCEDCGVKYYKHKVGIEVEK